MKFLLIYLVFSQICFYAQGESLSPRVQFNKAQEQSHLIEMEPRIYAAALKAELKISDFVLSKNGNGYFLTSDYTVCRFNRGFEPQWFEVLQPNLLLPPAKENSEFDSVECYIK